MFRINKLIFVFVLTTLFFSVSATAQTSRVYVAVNTGVDSGSLCQMSSPCQTITKAMSIVDAGGDIILIENGNYVSAEVTKSVTIEGAPGVNAGIIATGGFAAVYEVGLTLTDTITLRNLHFKGFSKSGTGILNTQAGALSVDNCDFTDFLNGISMNEGHFLSVHNSTFRGNHGGIYVTRSGEGVIRASIDSSKMESNDIGIELYGKVLANVRNSIVSFNTYRGIWVRSAELNVNGEMLLDNCELNHNLIGLHVDTANRGLEVVRLSRSTIINNFQTGVLMTQGATVYSLGNNVIVSNFPDISGGVLTQLAAK